MSYGGGSGSGINSVIEAQQRARELGKPTHPDVVEEETERKARRAAWGVAGLGVIGAAWLFVGTEAALIVAAVLAVGVLAVLWIRARARRIYVDPVQTTTTEIRSGSDHPTP